MKKKDLSKQRKNIVVREVKMDDSNNLMRSTFTVKKGQSVAFVVRDKNNKVRPLNYDKYEIHVEGIGSISTHYEAMDIGVPDRKKYQKIITKQYSNLSFKERVDIIRKPLTHLFRANKKNTTFRIILKSKETNFETHIFINVDANLIPYIMIPVGLIGGAAIVALPLIYHQKHEKPKETTQAMVVDLIEDEKNASNWNRSVP